VAAQYEPTSERVARIGDALRAQLRELLVQRSALVRAPHDSDGLVFVGFPTHNWQPLDEEGRALRADLLRRHGQFSELVAALLGRSPERIREDDSRLEETVRELIEQSEGSYYSTTQSAFEDADSAIETRVAEIRDLYDPSGGIPVFVPDANAIVWNEALDTWTFADADHFVLVLTSTLLGELDDLKIQHRNERVRESAESAIRRIKEFMRRGDIRAGVPLRGSSRVRLSATEPDFGATLRWLDPASKDDRLLASALEVVREYPHSPVLLVTRDVNMQNKAIQADLPYVEPPDPAEPRRPKAPPKPDVRILRFSDGDASSTRISFRVDVQNFEPRPIITTVTATLDGEPLEDLHPKELNLLSNTLPTTVSVLVPRPDLADKVKAFNDETTLYGRTLDVVIAVEGRETTAQSWTEAVYSAEDNAARHEIQQRLWRIGRGEASDADHRADAIQQMRERRASRSEH
jgi:hypothetical protein